MKRYNESEKCPACGHHRHVVHYQFGLDQSPAVPYLDRICLSCEATFRRAPLRAEKPDCIQGQREVDTRGDKP